MGQGLSCGASHEQGLFRAVQLGEVEIVKGVLEKDPGLLNHTTVYDRHSALHIAAANGQIDVGSIFISLVLVCLIVCLSFWVDFDYWVFLVF